MRVTELCLCLDTSKHRIHRYGSVYTHKYKYVDSDSNISEDLFEAVFLK